MTAIDSLLHRRPDLSTFLVHLTAASDEDENEANLISIVSSRRIEARNPYGLLRNYANDHRQTNPRLYETQRVVCLTETPLEHVWMMCADIDDRQHPLAGYGVAFSKSWARSVGANPVWYIDILRTGRSRDWLTVALFNLAQHAVRQGGQTYANPFDLTDEAEPRAVELPIETSPIADLAPFIETMGPVGQAGQPLRRREFWWEREWRYRSDLEFSWSDIVVAFAPAHRHTHVRRALEPHARDGDAVPAIVDPTWGLERMIGSLAGVADELAGPLPRY